MVPNLVAVGALGFGSSIDAFHFAWQHDKGNSLFLKSAKHILCISESTKHDFLKFYGLGDDARFLTVVPYEIDVTAPLMKSSEKPGGYSNLALVNVLDPRKNLRGISQALRQVVKNRPINVTIVGRERMPLEDVLECLNELADAGIGITWYRNASDAMLHSVYRQSDLLVFPSFYEGLGLPILEAQACGLPVVSSDLSSCREVNMNKGLCVPVGNASLLAERVSLALDRPQSLKRGEDLRNALSEWLEVRRTIPFLQA